MNRLDESLVGRRVVLLSCTDPYTNLQNGDKGEVIYLDDTGTVFVKWDKGNILGMVKEAGDSFALLPSE
jgi:Domain of unknown function (DUF4314)